MFGATIRRVVTDSDNFTSSSDRQEQKQIGDSGPNSGVGIPSTTENGQNFAPMVHDMEIDPAPVQLIDHGSIVFSENSSLSEASTGSVDKITDRNEKNANGYQNADIDEQGNTLNTKRKDTTTSNIRRMDSNNDSSSDSQKAMSSQNSSRDWGWFEDVHLAEHPIIGRKDRNTAALNRTGIKEMKGGRGLVPQVSRGEVEEMLIETAAEDPAAMAVTAPTYVLEESLSSQQLWKYTAGQRPPQPVEERAFYERMWAQNFARSQVKYSMPVEVLTAKSPISLSPFADSSFTGTNEVVTGGDYTVASSVHVTTSAQHSNGEVGGSSAVVPRVVTDSTAKNQLREDAGSGRPSPAAGRPMEMKKVVRGTGSDGDLVVLVRGDNAYGTTVSKSFACSSEPSGTMAGVVSVNVSIASYRVVDSKKYGKYAQFLVIYREGSIRDTVGVWKRYRDFEGLAKKVTQAHEGCANVIANISPLAVSDQPEMEHLPNAVRSWRLVKQRKRWYRCLDAGYLSLKVFLLERFLHDILFESSSPKLLRDFVGVGSGLSLEY